MLDPRSLVPDPCLWLLGAPRSLTLDPMLDPRSLVLDPGLWLPGTDGAMDGLLPLVWDPFLRLGIVLELVPKLALLKLACELPLACWKLGRLSPN